jgi:DNA ligase 1
MPSPSKKHKTNESQSSPQQTRSIESFFKGQPPKRLKTFHPPSEAIDEKTCRSLTDEELARKLQTQWDAENVGNTRTAAVKDLSGSEKDTNPKQLHVAGSASASSLLSLEPTAVGSATLTTRRDTLSLQSSLGSEDTTLSIPLDQSPLTFEPSKYVDELKSRWVSDHGDATYALLTRGFVLINGTQSRIKIVDTLVNLLRVIIEGDPSSLLPAVWLATNSFAPSYVPLELGLGGSSISKALKSIYGLNSQGLKTLYDKHGDAGDVAFEAKKRQSYTLKRPQSLTIKTVYQSLVKIAKSKGSGSQETKQRIVEKLLQDTRGAEESRYIVRTLVRHLRIGAVKTTMLIALGRAFLFSKPPEANFETRGSQELSRLKKEELAEVYGRAEELVKASYARHPNYDDLVPCLLEIGVTEELLVRCGLTLHVPLRPMLGSITRDLSEMLTKLQGRDFACEYKYDGQRAQVHCDSSGKVSIFSRHLELMTDKYPDLVAIVPEIRGGSVSSFILEGEVVAVDQTSGNLQTFQTLTNRAKKNVEISNIKVNVCLFSFDLMYLNGEPLLDRPFRERRSLLRSLFTEIPNRFTWVKSLDASSADSEMVLDFFKSATEEKCEGIMVKVLDNFPGSEMEKGGSITPDDREVDADEVAETGQNGGQNRRAPKSGGLIPAATTTKQELKERGSRRKALLSTYEPDKRLDSWLKVKKDYNTSSDTLDLVPVAGWHGQGRKAKWWSPILLAVRNPETGCLEAVTKCMSGFTDKFYQANKEKYAEDNGNIIARPSYIEYIGEPEVWFEPQEVWEVAFADITLSPTYTAAIGLASDERGLSLRFPRFLKVREDKSIEEASTSDFLAGLYRRQMERVKLEQGHDRVNNDDD